MSAHTPRFQGFEAKVRTDFARQAVMTTMGITIAKIGAGTVTLKMPFRADLTQQNGFLHAGVVSTALDSACGYAALTLMAEEASVLTTEFKINLLSPAAGSAFCFQAEVIRAGRTLSVAQATAFSLCEGGEKPIALMTATLMAVTDRPDVRAHSASA